ncbi:hypothetical protein GTP45_14155 [Pseudoduganella sp. FT55W]|uniref:Uncharacterized protein n=1 Tax=Duganella rivi TaxID=2666083 RepID=A0A7X4GQS3_9BURK|nr:hypothetical protein [Duganella rivi]MYM67965.1 hypothetical protein [Duganella rivi]
METQTTSTEEMPRTLLVRTAVLQAGNEALAASLAAAVTDLRDRQVAMQESFNALQVETAGIKAVAAHHATNADVERVRSELYKALEAQTWRMFVWLTAVCSGLTAAVYYIARNVH